MTSISDEVDAEEVDIKELDEEILASILNPNRVFFKTKASSDEKLPDIRKN